MGDKALTPEEARARAKILTDLVEYAPGEAGARLAATLRAYADQADALTLETNMPEPSNMQKMHKPSDHESNVQKMHIPAEWTEMADKAFFDRNASYIENLEAALAAVIPLVREDERKRIKASGHVIVPSAAIDFIKGAGPDHEGFWFGDEAMPGKGNFRWRTRFDAMIAAAEEGE